MNEYKVIFDAVNPVPQVVTVNEGDTFQLNIIAKNADGTYGYNYSIAAVDGGQTIYVIGSDDDVLRRNIHLVKSAVTGYWHYTVGIMTTATSMTINYFDLYLSVKSSTIKTLPGDQSAKYLQDGNPSTLTAIGNQQMYFSSMNSSMMTVDCSQLKPGEKFTFGTLGTSSITKMISFTVSTPTAIRGFAVETIKSGAYPDTSISQSTQTGITFTPYGKVGIIEVENVFGYVIKITITYL